MKFEINNYMRTPYTEKELRETKEKTIPCQCYFCEKTFYLNKNQALAHYGKNKSANKYCSHKCSTDNNVTLKIVNCKQCNKEFLKNRSQSIKHPNHFCTKSCAATYNNTHKTKGTRKSKLEFYLENKLVLLYPNLEFHFNRKDSINSELDIYIPSMKLAFELNGLFHYEPIFGENKLEQIQNNDKRKFQACLERNIELCIIDSSKLKYFKESNAKPYLDIIVDIINKKTYVYNLIITN